MIFSSEHPSYPVTFPSSTVSSLEKARAALLCHEQMVQEDPVLPSQRNHPLVSKTRAYCEAGRMEAKFSTDLQENKKL